MYTFPHRLVIGILTTVATDWPLCNRQDERQEPKEEDLRPHRLASFPPAMLVVLEQLFPDEPPTLRRTQPSAWRASAQESLKATLAVAGLLMCRGREEGGGDGAGERETEREVRPAGERGGAPSTRTSS